MANFERMLDRGRKTNTLHMNGEQPSHQQSQQQEQQNSQQNSQEMLQPPNYILYVWGNREKSSKTALRLAQELGLMEQVEIVDVRNTAPRDRPEWLRGVPTLLSEQEEMIWEGTDALDILEEIAEQNEYSQQTQYQQQQQQQPPNPQQLNRFPQMPRQTMPDGSVIQQRMPQMYRGADEQQPGERNSGRENPMGNMAMSDQKVSASTMKNEVDQILKRREQILQQAPSGNPQPLPTMSHKS